MALTVKKLIEELQKLNPTTLVVMAKDAEGNAFSPAHQVQVSTYKAERSWHGYLVESEPSKEDGTVEAAVLWPTC